MAKVNGVKGGRVGGVTDTNPGATGAKVRNGTKVCWAGCGWLN